MQDSLGLLDFLDATQDVIGLGGVLVFIEEGCDGLDGKVLISCEGSPLLADSLEECIENFVEESEDDAFGVALTDEGVGSDWLVGHLYVADLVVMDYTVAGVLADTGEGLPDDELEGVLDFIPQQVAH